MNGITIDRCYPIIDGCVQVPNMMENGRDQLSVHDALTNIPSASVTSLSLGSGRNTAGSFGAQQFLRVATFDTDGCCTALDPDPATAIYG